MKLVAYYRVSTKRQGRSGLGLAAQQSAVQAYADGRGNVIAEYTEVETGKKADRPKATGSLGTCPQGKGETGYRQARSACT